MSFKNILTTLFVISIFQSINGQNPNSVKFKNGVVEPIENIASFDMSNVAKREVVNDCIYRFLQFKDVLSSEDIAYMKQEGINLLSYISSNTYLASISTKINNNTLRSNNVRSIWSIDGDLKLDEDVSQRSLPDWAIEGENAILLIEYYKDLDQNFVIGQLEKNNIEVRAFNGFNNFLQVAIPIDRLEELGELPFVEWVEPKLRPGVKEDRRGRSLHRVNMLDPNMAGARNYTGKGINILLRDDGSVFEHIDFKGRLDQTFVQSSNGSHGDGVAGIMGGAGNLEPTNRGMAHESTIYVINYQPNFLDATMSLFTNRDVIVTNSSFGDGCNAGYTNNARIVDQQTYNNPTLMHVFSTGNLGQGNTNTDGELTECGYGAGFFWGNITGGHKQGKNVISTANVNYRGEVVNSSSRGPAHDGRIKPDIAANGNNHVSTAEEQGYISFGGTSGAAPVITGVMAMLHEGYELVHGERADAALLKAIMLNTATDSGNKGPDYTYGWGSLNAHRAALCMEESRFLKGEVNQSEITTHTIEVPENVAELRVMTYWRDPEANPNAPIALINDLDTELTDALGDTHLPWVLDPTPDPIILNSPATKGMDVLNNMEQISIDNPSSGTYTLSINGKQTPFGSHEYFVVWEFRMNEIEVIFPNGGENLNTLSNEVIHWDATGDDGTFFVSHIDSEGNETPIAQVPGHLRYFEWQTPLVFSEKSKIRVTRDGLVGESDGTFLLADNPENLKIEFNDDRQPELLSWNNDTIAVSFNIYLLGETKMEKIATTEDNSFIIPQESAYVGNWIAVSSNFEDGTEGKRSRAISTLPPPMALGINNVDDKPCLNEPVLFESLSIDTLLSYNWNFGPNGVPGDAFTKGPHLVFFTKKGPNLANLEVRNDGGVDNTTFILIVQDELEESENELIKEGGGEYTFKSTINGADSYTWNFGDGTTGSGKTVSHTYTETGDYTITLEAENTCGIVTAVSLVSINLNSVEDLTEGEFVISPNPNQGDFSVTIPDVEGEDVSIQLISIDGKLVDQKILYNVVNGTRISWDAVESGLYLLKFTIGSKEITKKIIVE